MLDESLVFHNLIWFKNRETIIQEIDLNKSYIWKNAKKILFKFIYNKW